MKDGGAIEGERAGQVHCRVSLQLAERGGKEEDRGREGRRIRKLKQGFA